MSRLTPSWPPVEVEPPVAHPKAPAPGTKLGVHFDECFGCGDAHEAGLHLRSAVGESQTVHSLFTVTAAHQGAPGLAHGGLLACAFDEALGATVGNLLRKPAVTGKLETDFLRPVPVGSTLHIAAKLDGVAGRKVYVSAAGHLDAADGPVAVRARALFVIVGVEHFTTHGDVEAMRKLADAHEKAKKDRQDWEINP
ncbi:PaaI family thioesterase [Amycolatopsis sp. H20-H5]|uniref:PaaI family thioesterase n=1 Tax=Amycolatopsis sp. H20-H5 TaxID=3046309 RepID=UPI002DB6B24C|nr:hotdog fold domain-containing protein [Amycolatopsis sp. H20-H5]MEC3975444.1 hotdog fold domain-containing protein [Amycolatopsis sp. H20-H5]